MGLLYILIVWISFVIICNGSKDVFIWETKGYSKIQIQTIAKTEKLTIHHPISRTLLLVSREPHLGRHLVASNTRLESHTFKFKYDSNGLKKKILVCTVDDVIQLSDKLKHVLPVSAFHLHSYDLIDNLHYLILHVHQERYIKIVLDQLAKITSIIWYDFYRQHTKTDRYSSEILLLGNALHTDKSKWYLPFTGKNEIITIADTGIDYTHCAFQPSINPYRATFTGHNHDLIANEIVKSSNRLLAYIRLEFHDGVDTVSTDFEDEQNGHGTHVSGSAIGDDTSCDSKIYEVKSQAQLIFFDIGVTNHDYLFTPPLLTPLMQISYKANSRVFSNSWGVMSDVYDSYAFELDSFVYKHDDYVILFAAGNSGPNASTILSPALAKNIISVGASQNQLQDFLVSKDEYWENYTSLFKIDEKYYKSYDYVNMPAFSSRGPTFDGRIKPDLLSPGEFVLSARAKAEKKYLWLYNRGSSMATPELGGKVLCLREIFRTRHNIVSPSAALIKNILITTAEPLSGAEIQLYKMNGTIFTKITHKTFTVNDEGFGRANILSFGKGLVAWEDRVPMKTFSKAYTKCFKSKISSSASFGLVWSDPPSKIHADKILVNDLNLQVTINDQITWYGNGLFNESDSVNNVEKISGHLMENDEVVIYVSAYGLIDTLPPVDVQYFTLVYPAWLEPSVCKGESLWEPSQQCDLNTTIGYISKSNGNCEVECGVNKVMNGDTCICNANIMCAKDTFSVCERGIIGSCVSKLQPLKRRALIQKKQNISHRSLWLVMSVTTIVSILMFVVLFILR